MHAHKYAFSKLFADSFEKFLDNFCMQDGARYHPTRHKQLAK